MWFDARAKLAEIAGERTATFATTATQPPAVGPMSQMSQVSRHPETPEQAFLAVSVATPPRSKLQAVHPARADGLALDTGAYLDRLHLNGPATYGAMATTMGWGATRAWRTEAALRALGLVRLGRDGHAEPIPKKGNP